MIFMNQFLSFAVRLWNTFAIVWNTICFCFLISFTQHTLWIAFKLLWIFIFNSTRLFFGYSLHSSTRYSWTNGRIRNWSTLKIWHIFIILLLLFNIIVTIFLILLFNLWLLHLFWRFFHTLSLFF